MEYTYQHNTMNGNLSNPYPCPEVTMQDAPHCRYNGIPTTDHWSHQLLTEFQAFVQYQAPHLAMKTSSEGDCMDVEMVDATSSDKTTTMMDFVMYDAVDEAMQIVVEDLGPLMGLEDCQMVDGEPVDGDWLMAY